MISDQHQINPLTMNILLFQDIKNRQTVEHKEIIPALERSFTSRLTHELKLSMQEALPLIL